MKKLTLLSLCSLLLIVAGCKRCCKRDLPCTQKTSCSQQTQEVNFRNYTATAAAEEDLEELDFDMLPEEK